MAISWSDHAQDLASLRWALVLDPENASLWLKQADLLDQVGQSTGDSLRRAIQLSPRDALVWMRSGLDAEARQDYPAAERFLLEAARVSQLYEPRWTLANFYFRRGARDEFWKWARAALDLEPRDATMLLALCWSVSQDGDEIVRRCIPPRQRVLRQYVRFLIQTDHLPEASAAARALEAGAEIDDRDVLLELSDALVNHRRTDDALHSWNALCGLRQQECETLDPADLNLTERTLRSTLRDHGFAWRAAAAPGATTSAIPGATIVYFDGQEPEDVEPLWRYLPAVPGKRYQLGFETRAHGIPQGSGLRWQVSASAFDRNWELAHSADLSASDWTRHSQTFDVPAGAHLIKLSLRYARAPGSVRIDGSVATRGMRLMAVP